MLLVECSIMSLITFSMFYKYALHHVKPRIYISKRITSLNWQLETNYKINEANLGIKPMHKIIFIT